LSIRPGKESVADIQARCRGGQHKWSFQQNGMPVHTDYLKNEKIDFIEPDMWPPNSPDLNPVDYAVWGALQQRVPRTKI